MYPTIFKPPPKRFIDFTRMDEHAINRELKRVQANVDHLARDVRGMEEYLIQQAYRGK